MNGDIHRNQRACQFCFKINFILLYYHHSSLLMNARLIGGGVDDAFMASRKYARLEKRKKIILTREKCSCRSTQHPHARPCSGHTTTIRYDVRRSYIYMCESASFMAFCSLGQGSSIFLLSLKFDFLLFTSSSPQIPNRAAMNGNRTWALQGFVVAG